MKNNYFIDACRWLLLALLLAGPAHSWAQAPAFNQAISFNSMVAPGTSRSNAIALDAAGNQYVTGTFRGPLVLGTIILTSVSYSDMFVAKRSGSTGAWLWAVRAGDNGDAEGFGVAVDAAGNALVTGRFYGTASFGTSPTATSLTSAGNYDIFVAKFGGSTGSCAWAVRAGAGAGAGGTQYGRAVAVDAAGNALVTGSFQGTVSFGTSPTATSLTSAGGDDIFVAKFGTSTGAAAWAVRAGGSGDDGGSKVAVDAAGNALVTGSFQGTVSFGTSPTATSLTSAGNSDLFVAKFGTNTGAAAWAVRAGGSGEDYGSGVAVDAAGSALVTGSFAGTTSFGTSPTATSLTSAGGYDLFVAKFGAGTGAAAWAVRAGGSSNDVGSGIAVDAAGNALVTGYFYGTASFGSQTLTGNGDTGFVAVLGNAGALATAAGLAVSPATVYPNPAHGMASLTGAAPHAPLTLCDALGRTVRTATTDASGAAPLDLHGLPAGLYMLRESSSGATRRLVVE